MSKSKDIGTWTETQVKKHARANGFPHADRHVLSGKDDVGDIWLDPFGRLVVEVKGGEAAEKASDSQVRAWLVETERERVNAGAQYAFLVLKRPGKGAQQVGQWWAVIGLDAAHDYLRGAAEPLTGVDDGPIVRTTLAEALELFRGSYGEAS